MPNLFIVGDSYCYYRSDPQSHWPARLAQNLKCKLHGRGFPGQGWWPTRKAILEYASTDDFSATDLFVICHTEPCRIISGNPNLLTDDIESTKKTYFTYIQSDDVSSWAVTNWYKELNDIFKNKPVLHLPCFHHSEFSMLHGKKLLTSLSEISIQSAGGNLKLPYWGGKTISKKMNEYENHFSPETNRAFADFLTDKFLNCHDDADLVYNN